MDFLLAHPGNQQSCSQENSVRPMLCETRTCIYNKCMLIAQDCIKFRWCIARQSFLVNSFADFLDVVLVKKSRFRSVISGVSLWQHLLLYCLQCNAMGIAVTMEGDLMYLKWVWKLKGGIISFLTTI